MNLAAILDKLGGGAVIDTVIGLAKDYFPSEQAKLEFEAKAKKAQADYEMRQQKIAIKAQRALDSRIAEQEGTAKDLRTIPILGPLMIFLRAAQRPIWGFATLFMDFKWFFSAAVFTERQELAMITINILVLGFLFGERAIQNVMPLITKLFEAKKG